MSHVPISEVLAQYSLSLPQMKRSHSGPDTTHPTYPRTDMKQFEIWDTFKDEVASWRPTLESTTTTAVPDAGILRAVGNEADVVGLADQYVLAFVERLMSSCGTDGEFGPHNGNEEAVCDPDRIWTSGASLKPTFVVEFKSWWAFKEAGDLTQRINTEDKVARAVGQIYGYMSFNHLRYGALSTFETTWFFRRLGASNSGVFEVTRPISYQNAAFLIEAYMFVLSANDWFHASPFNSPKVPRKFRVPDETLTIIDRYKILPVRLNQFHLSKSIQRSRSGSIVDGYLGLDRVVMKLVDASKNHVLAEELAHEVSVYQNLEEVQGKFVPRLVAYGEVWNMLHFIALEPGTSNVADHLRKHPEDHASFLSAAMNCLHALHAQNITHGDVKLENFIVRGTTVQIIDFGLAMFNATEAGMQTEKGQLEQAFQRSRFSPRT